MSNGKEFLDLMRKQADDSGYSGGGDSTIAPILIEVGLHRYVTGHDFWSFWKAVSDKAEMKTVGEELTARLNEAGSTDRLNYGIKITVKKDALGRKPFKADLQEFIPDWQDGYALVVDAIVNLNLPIGELFYGAFQYKSNPHSVKKGEAGKTEIDQNGVARFPSIRLPVEKFANEAAAQAAVGDSGQDQDSGNETELPENEILEWMGKLEKGIAFNNDPVNFPLPSPNVEATRKAQIAELYQIAISDIDKLME